MGDHKIIFDARMYRDSGIGVYIQNILSGFAEIDIYLKYIGKSDDADFILASALQGDQLHFVPFDAKIYSISELFGLPFKTLGSEVFWSPHYNIPFFNFSSKLKIVTIHDVFHLAFYGTLTAKQKLYARLMLNRAVKYSDLIFTVSNFSKAEIIKYVPCNPDKIVVVYNGVDFERFNRESSRDNVLAYYNIISPYVLFVGNIKPHKNLKMGLYGFRDYCEHVNPGSNLKFVIVGKRTGFITGDPEVYDLLEQPFFKDRVIFTDWVKDDDLSALYQNAKVFLFPSLYEGFGFPPLEAMAAGCPVISSNTACMPEICGDAAYYFDPNNIQEISGAIDKVVKNEDFRLRLINAGFVQVKKYTWENAIRKKIETIKNVLKK